MHTRASHDTSDIPGLTLLEVVLALIVVFVLVVLLLFPAIGTKDSAPRAKAGSDIQATRAAVQAYVREYGRYPDPVLIKPEAGLSAADAKVGDSRANTTIPNSYLYSTLRAISEDANKNHIQNPLKIPFFEGRRANSAGSPKDGFQDHPTGGNASTRRCLFDPWGTQYCVVLDTNGDQTIDLAGQYSDFVAPNAPRVPVGAFSLGKDRALGARGNGKFREGATKSDDVISWE